MLAVGFARLPWRGRWLTWLWGGLVGTALAYAAVGGYQWVTRDVFWNPSVKVFNAYAPFFRVNSVFWDPSVYGRYLTVAILASLAGILLGGVRGWRVAGLYARGGRDLARAPHLLLAVELRRAGGRHRRRRGGRVGAQDDARPGRARGGHRRRAAGRAAGPRRARRQVALGCQPDHVRSGQPRRSGDPHHDRPSPRRSGCGRVLPRVRPPPRDPRQGPQAGRVPHDAGDGRGGRGDRRPRAPRLAPRGRVPRHVARASVGASRRGSRSRRGSSSSRSPYTASSMQRSSRIR